MKKIKRKRLSRDQVSIHGKIDYIIRKAQEHDSRVVQLGKFVFFQLKPVMHGCLIPKIISPCVYHEMGKDRSLMFWKRHLVFKSHGMHSTELKEISSSSCRRMAEHVLFSAIRRGKSCKERVCNV